MNKQTDHVPAAGAVIVWRRLWRHLWGVLLLVALAPLLIWATPLVLLFLVWPLLASLNPLQSPAAGLRRRDVLRDVCLFLLFCLPLLGLLRGAQLGLWLAWPPVIELANLILQPGVQRFGISFVPFFDLLLGASAVLVAGLFAIQDLLWRVSGQKRVARLPRSQVAGLPTGLVKLQGVAQPLYDQDSDILYYLPPTHSGGEYKAQHNSFYLEDETGRVLVDTTGACFSDQHAQRGEHQGMFDYLRAVAGILDTRCSEIVLPLHEGSAPDGRREWRMKSGDSVFLVGVVQSRFTGSGDGGELVIRPQPHLFGGHYHQFFYLTNGAAEVPGNYFRHGLFYAGLHTLLTIFFSSWLAWIGWQGVQDFEAAYGYEYVEPVEVTFQQTVIPLEERKAQVPGLGLISVGEMLQALRHVPAGQLIHLLTVLEQMSAQERVIPVLQDIVLDDPDNARRHLAQNKLRVWGAHVPIPVSQFSVLYLGGERLDLGNATAEELMNLVRPILSSCEGTTGGKGVWAQRESLTSADRLAFRLAGPLAWMRGRQELAILRAGVILPAGEHAGKIFVYTESDFHLMHSCNAGLTNALWCHSGLRKALGKYRPQDCES